ncbi:MAG TPA: hypothetical protein VFD37_06280, partial [Solirubrobacterales bacterium]|nr:hypothetical protein [Solirubrobacterales bacterium]
RLANATATDLGRRLPDLPPPIAHRVEHLPGALAQARPGHPARIAAIAALAATELPSLQLAGPHIAGSGIGACLATASLAAEALRGSTRPARR